MLWKLNCGMKLCCSIIEQRYIDEAAFGRPVTLLLFGALVYFSQPINLTHVMAFKQRTNCFLDLFLFELILDIVKIDWACNPCTKTAAVRSNCNKQSSLQRSKAWRKKHIKWASYTNWYLTGDMIGLAFDTFWQELAFIFVRHSHPLCWICCWQYCCQTCFPPHEESTLHWPTFSKECWITQIQSLSRSIASDKWLTLASLDKVQKFPHTANWCHLLATLCWSWRNKPGKKNKPLLWVKCVWDLAKVCPFMSGMFFFASFQSFYECYVSSPLPKFAKPSPA